MKYAIWGFILLFTQGIVIAQTNPFRTTTHTIASKVYGQDRTISVFLPNAYDRRAPDSVMVTYVLDAQYEQFRNMANATIDYLADNVEVLPMIVVGIHSQNRSDEFLPDRQHQKEGDKQFGNSDKLERHLKEEVFPLIEKTYRARKYRAIIGHSLGGSFVINAAFDGSELFDAYLAISPNLEYDQRQILSTAAHYLETHDTLNAFIWVSAGDIRDRERMFTQRMQRLDSLVRQAKPAQLIWKATPMQQRDHWTTVIPSIQDGLVALTYTLMVTPQRLEAYATDTSLSIGAQIQAFYQQAAARSGFYQLPFPREADLYGGMFKNMEKYEAAVEVLDWAISLYPDYLELYLSKGSALEALGDRAVAHAFFVEVLQKVESLKSSLSEEEYAEYKVMFEKREKRNRE